MTVFSLDGDAIDVAPCALSRRSGEEGVGYRRQPFDHNAPRIPMQRRALCKPRINRVDDHFISVDQLTELPNEHTLHGLRRRIAFRSSHDTEGPELIERRNQRHGVAIGELGRQGQTGRDDAQATRTSRLTGSLQHGKQQERQQSSGQVIDLHGRLVARRRLDLPAVHLPVPCVEKGDVQTRQGLASLSEASDRIIAQHVELPDLNLRVRMSFTKRRRSLLALCDAPDSHDQVREMEIEHNLCAPETQAGVAAGYDGRLVCESGGCWGRERFRPERCIDEAGSLAPMVWW